MSLMIGGSAEFFTHVPNLSMRRPGCVYSSYLRVNTTPGDECR